MANKLYYTTTAFSNYFDGLKVIQGKVKFQFLTIRIRRLFKEANYKCRLDARRRKEVEEKNEIESIND